ncbi:hypothetical protein GPB2148_1343 [marine gamma proteobacterium HTCC2148]|nr:hypothetical protein GPB2148_1343 [marine gamma proteobacterium HTCC2148]
MPPGAKDIDEAVRLGLTLPEPESYFQESVEKEPSDALIDFDSFILTESSEQMEKRMLDDTYVLGRMAVMGQFTVFYGGPNTGKTLIGLKLLVDSIQSGQIEAKNVYYINADDTYKGVVTKKRLAEEYGFNMIVPSMNGFQADMLVEILRNRTAGQNASGCIVILDTLKKFTDLMSKGMSSSFGDVQRGFISGGGTVIGYAHVNKAKNDDGESVHAGTTDIIDDGDCAYVLDIVEDNGAVRTVKFKNIKDRGDVAQFANFQYKSKGDDPSLPYMELFYSVSEVDAVTAIKAQERAAVAEKLAINDEVIGTIKECIQAGFTQKTELLTESASRLGITRNKVGKVLTEHAGTDKHQGKRWNFRVGERNAHVFFVL